MDLLDEYKDIVKPVLLRVAAGTKVEEKVIDLSRPKRIVVITMPEDSTVQDMDEALNSFHEAIESPGSYDVVVCPHGLIVQVIDL